MSRLPDAMDPRLCDVLRARGIHRLYCHQAECFRLAQEARLCGGHPHRQRKDPVLQSARGIRHPEKQRRARPVPLSHQGALGRSGQRPL